MFSLIGGSNPLYTVCHKEDVPIYFHMTILQEADVDDDDVDDDADEKVNISHCYEQWLFVMINTNQLFGIGVIGDMKGYFSIGFASNIQMHYAYMSLLKFYGRIILVGWCQLLI